MAACAILASGAPLAAQDDWVRPLGGQELRVLAADSTVALRVPLELEAGAAVDSAWLVDVAVAGFRDQGMFDAFTVAVDSTGQALSLALDLDALDRPDTIAVRVAVRDSSRTARLDLRLLRPAAALADPGTIRVRSVPGEEGETPLILRETTRRSRITGLTLLSLPFTAEGDRPTPVRVVLADGAPDTVPAGGAITLPFRVEGDLPIGTTLGSVEIGAPQLAAPMIVQFELLRQRSLWTLGLAILLGLVLGWLVRTYLQQKREVAEARQQADALLRRLREARRGRADTEFRRKVDAQIGDLEKAVAAGRAAGITAAMETADSALDAAIVELQGRLDVQAGRLQRLAGLAGRGMHLPRPIDTILLDLRDRTEAARRAIEQADAGTAADTLDAAHSEVLVGGLRQALADWRADVGEAYAAVREGRHGLPGQVVEKLGPRIETLQAELDAIQTLSASADTDAIVATLQAIDGHRLAARQRIRPVPGWVRAVHGAVVDILGPADGAAADAAGPMQRLDEAIDALEAAVRDAPELEDALEAVTRPALRQAWEDAIRARARGTVDEDELDRHLDRHDYIAAAELVTKPTDTALGGGRAEAPAIELEDATGVTGAIAGRARAAVAALAAARVPALERHAALDVRRTRGFWEVGGAKLVQWLIFAVIIAVTGILVFREDYAGTFADLAGAFLWGFSLDVTADAVAEQIKGIRSG